jgi:DNA-binding SARP family transcriptional activator
MNQPLAPTSPPSELSIALLGGFRFWVRGKDALPDLPGGSQRLLAFLALQERTLMRDAVAGSLWPDASEDHAHASLRSALNRLTMIAHEAVLISHHSLRLADNVAVDLRAARAQAQRLLNTHATSEEEDLSGLSIGALSADLLPDWYDDWAVIEAEDWRQLRLHALDALTGRLVTMGRFAEAISAGLAAVRTEPLRETAHAALIRAHLAEGNRAEAIAAFGRYRAVLKSELSVEPSPSVQALIEGL